MIIDAALAAEEQWPLPIGREAEAAADPRQPLRPEGLPADRPERIGCFPDGFQDREPARRDAHPSGAASSQGPRFRRWPLQQPDRVLAVVTAVGAKLVQDAPLLAP